MDTDQALLALQSFREADRDGSGTVSHGEITACGGYLGPFPVDQMMWMRLDKNRDGRVEFMEVLQMMFPNVPVRNVKSWMEHYAPTQKRIKQF